MKEIKSSMLTVLVALWASVAVAQVTTNHYTFTVNANQAVPDANSSGLTSVGSFTGMSGYISDITVNLNLGSTAGSTAFNGDIYAYLVGPAGGYAVLLNRVGVGSGSAFGYSDTGFDVTFTTTGSDIHFYQNGSYNLNGDGQLTGTWGADGRAIDPDSNPSLFDSTTSTALLNSFMGTTPNGNWTLFVADLSAEGDSTLVSWTATIATVPEPSTGAFLAAGILLLVALTHYRISVR